ncbi:hypothetical protein JCM21738_5518 [Mesobacillus boroniphilus JCM 21738]|uniref:Uncharacterized protein n=1 Tax=Mesobacillus boroniphilus JCM 21738 TaxID=1294265 RepID=W4RVG4_9BACI|nr:hypothetical protein JCM21738_5518 [Mesobacillus boroniphilus JCM 21738]
MSPEDTGKSVNITESIYWDDKKIKEYLEFKLNVDGRFHFPNEKASTLAEDLKPFFISRDTP